jgi:hypothetical protein
MGDFDYDKEIIRTPTNHLLLTSAKSVEHIKEQILLLVMAGLTQFITIQCLFLLP